MPDSTARVITRADELNAVGAKCFASGEMEPARLHFLAALYVEPNHAQALQNLGAVLRNLGHYEAAASMARRSVAASSNNPYCRVNLGVSQIGLRRYDEALVILRGVVDDLPNAGPVWHNYGLALYMTNQREEALAAFDKGLALDPSNVQAQSDRALALLSLGRIQEGLAAYEVRWDLLFRNKIWELGVPEWKGENLRDQNILVHHEQGFGDSIMLVRLLKPLWALGCHITLAVPQELVKLFARTFVGTVVALEDVTESNAEHFSYHSPLLSVARWLKLDHPRQIDARPYLISDGDFNLTLPKANVHIGICWASGNHGPSLVERRRVVPLTQFLPLTELPGVSLVSLQKGNEANDIPANGLEGIVYDVSSRLEDFAATADVMSHLDLVISVDSAVAHVAGAIGKPCLMLSPYTRCWRWWDHTSGWPWYTNMRQYHQAPNGSWDDAMREVLHEIKDVYI